MADSPIRDGGDQPLDDEKPLRTATDGATAGADGETATDRATTRVGHGEHGDAPLPGGDAAGPLDGADEPGPDGEQPPVPTGGEPPAPDPNVQYDGQADFTAEATGERYTRSVQEGLDAIDEHKARIAELEAERDGAPDVPDEPLQPGPGAPDVPGGPDPSSPEAPEVPVLPDAPGAPGAPATPGAPTGPDAPQGPGVLRPTSGGDDPSGLDDPYDGGVPR
ncbi:hypothetical protein ABIB37_000598 [Agrococcus sp. UYP10]|uniref:hypothetical protein n=1 Tax=Agrococcus sp. UYP10 TaxID=1756355 RepID=UPI003396F89D